MTDLTAYNRTDSQVTMCINTHGAPLYCNDRISMECVCQLIGIVYLLIKSYQQAVVFQPNSVGLERKEMTEEVNDGNLHVYINRDIFLS